MENRNQGKRRGNRRGGRRYPPKNDEPKEVWIPKTEVGKKVLAGQITTIDQILDSGKPIMEVEIVDHLLPGLQEEVIDVRRVQRTLDSGRRMRFSVMAAVGDKNSHVGIGIAKGVEAGPTIRKAIARAKLNVVSVKRACSSWECGCGEPHTVPVKLTGKQGSVSVTLVPAPKGLGLVASDTSKTILQLAGIQDVWSFSAGQTRTAINQVLAVFDALKKLSSIRNLETIKVKEVKEEPKAVEAKKAEAEKDKTAKNEEKKAEEAVPEAKPAEKPAEDTKDKAKPESGSKS